MKNTLRAALGLAAASPLLAEGTVNSTVAAFVDNLKATSDYIQPIFLGILAIFLTVGLLKKSWRRTT